MKALLRGLIAMLREIADENAYERYLRAQGCAHSAAEWRRFLDQRLKNKYSRAKCC